MTAVYLDQHPPARQQFYKTRSSAITGVIVVHTAENMTDLVLPDSGAEGVASFISRRSDAGSYHSVVDSDSVVRVGEYGWTMFHVKGLNSPTLGLSFACKAGQWGELFAKGWGQRAIPLGAQEAANMARWVKKHYGIDIPARKITAAQAKAGVPGFVYHGGLDPGRRSDPGSDFPLEEFLNEYKKAISGGGPPSKVSDPVALGPAANSQQRLNAQGVQPPLAVDGDWGPKCDAALDEVLRYHNHLINGLRAELDEQSRINTGLNVRLEQAEEKVRDLEADLVNAVTGSQGDGQEGQAFQRLKELRELGIEAREIKARAEQLLELT